MLQLGVWIGRWSGCIRQGDPGRLNIKRPRLPTGGRRVPDLTSVICGLLNLMRYTTLYSKNLNYTLG